LPPRSPRTARHDPGLGGNGYSGRQGVTVWRWTITSNHWASEPPVM
jgi:hypothetical protein